MMVPVVRARDIIKRFKPSLRMEGLHLKLGTMPKKTGVLQALYICVQGNPTRAYTAMANVRRYIANPTLYLQISQRRVQHDLVLCTGGLFQRSIPEHGDWFVAAKWRASDCQGQLRGAQRAEKMDKK